MKPVGLLVLVTSAWLACHLANAAAVVQVPFFAFSAHRTKRSAMSLFQPLDAPALDVGVFNSVVVGAKGGGGVRRAKKLTFVFFFHRQALPAYQPWCTHI